MIEINGQMYKKVDKAAQRMRIVICDNRGLTFIGKCDPTEGDNIVIEDARCIIRWGTTKHLAELANNGRPLDGTKLGSKRTVTVRRDNIIAWYDVDDWQ